MPLFFFLAGLTFKVEKYQSFAILIRTKFNQLIIPYFIFAFVQWLWTVAKQVVLAREALDIGYLCKQFVGIFLQIRTTSFGPGVWFIPCIFCAYILLFLICTFASGSRVRLSISALTCLLIGYYCTFINLKLPWGWDAAFVAVFFILFVSGVTNPKVSGVHDQIQPEKKSHYRCSLRTCTLESANNPVERTSNERVKW